MLNPTLYKSSRTYDFFMKLLGYENAIGRFLQQVQIDCPSDCRVLDAGCGTGLLGFHFLDRFPQATLVATDLEPNFLRLTIANAGKRGIDRDRIQIGVADISTPNVLTTLDGDSCSLKDSSFDLICVGAVVGYAEDTEASIRGLIRLIAPGGYLINIEMSESLTGRFVSKRYQYRNITLSRMQEVIRDVGCDVTATRLNLRHLPAKLTRTAIIARKRQP